MSGASYSRAGQVCRPGGRGDHGSRLGRSRFEA